MTTARRSRWTYLLVAGGLLAISGPAYYLYATSQPVIGANIGADFAMMWTALWGLPWSIWPWTSLNQAVGNDSQELAFIACALVSVALLARSRIKTTSRPRSPFRSTTRQVTLVRCCSITLTCSPGPASCCFHWPSVCPGRRHGPPPV